MYEKNGKVYTSEEEYEKELKQIQQKYREQPMRQQKPSKSNQAVWIITGILAAAMIWFGVSFADFIEQFGSINR